LKIEGCRGKWEKEGSRRGACFIEKLKITIEF
jgi:hypothetical protein